MSMPKRVLFLCTGNYYRSRFAEILFNALAEKDHLDWIADSRGLAIELAPPNGGALSPWAIQGLIERNIPLNHHHERSPRALQEEDLTQAQLVIALNQVEHRPYLEKQFPAWAQRIEYWHIADLDYTPADEGLTQIERHVRALIEQLTRAA